MRAERKRNSGALDRRAVARGRHAPMPGFIEPCDPTLRERAPQGPEWVHEIKADGYRAQLHRKGDQVRIYSRNGHDWTGQFAALAAAAAALDLDEAIFDGEAAVLGASGLPD